MNIFKSISLFILVGVFSLGSLNAGIVGASGTGIVISAPAVLSGAEPNYYPDQAGFNERQATTWQTGYDTYLDWGTIAAGTVVSSHRIFMVLADYDLIEDTWTFNSPIIGVIYEHQDLQDTNSIFGHPSTTYTGSSTPQLGLEIPDDNFSVVGNEISITMEKFYSGDYLDSIRVLTQQVPEPSTYLLLGSMLMIAGVAKKKKQALARS